MFQKGNTEEAISEKNARHSGYNSVSRTCLPVTLLLARSSGYRTEITAVGIIASKSSGR
jgi:hypothetical protein